MSAERKSVFFVSECWSVYRLLTKFIQLQDNLGGRKAQRKNLKNINSPVPLYGLLSTPIESNPMIANAAKMLSLIMFCIVVTLRD